MNAVNSSQMRMHSTPSTMYARVHNGMDQRQLVESALAHDALVYRTDQCWFSNPADRNTLMIGFSGIALEDIAPGVRALRDAWLAQRSAIVWSHDASVVSRKLSMSENGQNRPLRTCMLVPT